MQYKWVSKFILIKKSWNHNFRKEKISCNKWSIVPTRRELPQLSDWPVAFFSCCHSLFVRIQITKIRNFFLSNANKKRKRIFFLLFVIEIFLLLLLLWWFGLNGGRVFEIALIFRVNIYINQKKERIAIFDGCRFVELLKNFFLIFCLFLYIIKYYSYLKIFCFEIWEF
jgi:hypothetical protein